MEAREGRLALRLGASAFVAVFLTFAASSAAAQDRVPPAPPAAPDQLTFDVDQILVIFQIAEAQSTDFEVTMGKVKDVLARSDKPERKQQAARWKLMKVATPQNGLFTYFFLIDQVVKGVTYDPFKILSEGLPAEEVKALFEKLSPGLKSVSTAPLSLLIGMGGGTEV